MLGRKDEGESDRVLSVLSLEQGKFNARARGARKASSKFSGLTEPLTIATLSFAQTKKTPYLTQGEGAAVHVSLRRDYERISYALSLVEAVERLVPFHKPVPTVFGLLLAGLEHIATHESPLIATLWAELQLLTALGYPPQFDACVLSNEPLSENPCFVSPQAGGYVHSSMARDYGEYFVAPGEVVKGLHLLSQTTEPPKAFRRPEESWMMLGKFWRYYTESPLPARALIEKELQV